ncbi:hypothetical protein AFLA_005936 [Aspergillus flavus NRRL3357]|nr:hypothetical protein AFLA_005936 [Aspergillus flavus NRRL3357]
MDELLMPMGTSLGSSGFTGVMPLPTMSLKVPVTIFPCPITVPDDLLTAQYLFYSGSAVLRILWHLFMAYDEP